MRLLFFTPVVLLLAVQGASAQQPYRYSNQPGTYGPYSRPALNPYLNLLRGGNPAANYYLGVLPERDRRGVAVQQGAEIQELEQRTSTPPAAEREPPPFPQLPRTGHATYFLNHASYYNFGTAGPGRAGLTAPAAPAAPPAMQRRTR